MQFSGIPQCAASFGLNVVIILYFHGVIALMKGYGFYIDMRPKQFGMFGFYRNSFFQIFLRAAGEINA